MKLHLIIILFSINLFSYAQGIDISAGVTPNGYGGSINYERYFEPNYSYVQIGLHGSYENTEYSEYKVPYSDLTLHLGYFYPVFENYRQTFQIAAGVGLVGGYEMVNMGGKEFLPDGARIKSKSNYLYGGFASGEMIFGLSRNLFTLVKYNQYYHLNSDLGPLSFYAGIGIRHYLDI